MRWPASIGRTSSGKKREANKDSRDVSERSRKIEKCFRKVLKGSEMFLKVLG